MTWRPRPGKVFIKPAEKATESAGGLAIVSDWSPEVSGTVMAIGPTERDPGFVDGDFVLFSPTVGQEISIGSDRWLIVPVEQILAVEERL